jgi:hypothetical protein
MPKTYSTHVRVENSYKILDEKPEGKRPTLIMKDLKEIALEIRTALNESRIGASDRLLCAWL